MSNDLRCSICGCLFKTSGNGFIRSFEIKNRENKYPSERNKTWICEKCYPGLGEGEKKKFILMQEWGERNRAPK